MKKHLIAGTLLALLSLLLHVSAHAATTCTAAGAGHPLSATLTFSAVTVDQNNNPLPAGTVVTYNVYMGTASGAETLLASGKSGSPIQINAGLTAGTSYYFQVAGVDSNGVGLMSNEVCMTFAPPVPGLITITIS